MDAVSNTKDNANVTKYFIEKITALNPSNLYDKVKFQIIVRGFFEANF